MTIIEAEVTVRISSTHQSADCDKEQKLHYERKPGGFGGFGLSGLGGPISAGPLLLSSPGRSTRLLRVKRQVPLFFV